MARRFILAVMYIVLISSINRTHADVDPAIINNEAIVLDVIAKAGTSELRGAVNVTALRAKLVDFMNASFQNRGVNVPVLNGGSDLSSTKSVPPLTLLYVRLRIDLDLVAEADGTTSIVGAIGTFFQKEGIVAGQSMQPLTLFVSTGNPSDIERHVHEAAHAQLMTAVIEPVAHWNKR